MCVYIVRMAYKKRIGNGTHLCICCVEFVGHIFLISTILAQSQLNSIYCLMLWILITTLKNHVTDGTTPQNDPFPINLLCLCPLLSFFTHHLSWKLLIKLPHFEFSINFRTCYCALIVWFNCLNNVKDPNIWIPIYIILIFIY